MLTRNSYPMWALSSRTSKFQWKIMLASMAESALFEDFCFILSDTTLTTWITPPRARGSLRRWLIILPQTAIRPKFGTWSYGVVTGQQPHGCHYANIEGGVSIFWMWQPSTSVFLNAAAEHAWKFAIFTQWLAVTLTLIVHMNGGVCQATVRNPVDWR